MASMIFWFNSSRRICTGYIRTMHCSETSETLTIRNLRLHFLKSGTEFFSLIDNLIVSMENKCAAIIFFLSFTGIQISAWSGSSCSCTSCQRIKILMHNVLKFCFVYYTLICANLILYAYVWLFHTVFTTILLFRLFWGSRIWCYSTKTKCKILLSF